jgi:hypothetical protein
VISDLEDHHASLYLSGSRQPGQWTLHLHLDIGVLHRPCFDQGLQVVSRLALRPQAV